MKRSHFSVAVCMATYNGEKYLAAQLDSLFAQTFSNFMLYISDDCSVDGTVAIIEEYKKVYPNRIVLYCGQETRGVVKNFEWLISSCTETYMALCDQDDVWFPEKLENELNAIVAYPLEMPLLVHSDLQMRECDLSLLYASYFNYRGIFLDEERALHRIIGHNGVMGCTVVMNQALKKKILPFPAQLDVHDYWIALVAEVCGRRVTLKKPLLHYRIHAENSSNNRDKIVQRRTFPASIFNRDPLPFRGVQREVILKEFLERYTLSKKESRVVNGFIDYLENRKNPFLILYQVIKYRFFRKSIRYKIKIYMKILFYR